jgi:hypothetical protein
VASGGDLSHQPAMNAAVFGRYVVSVLVKGDTWALAY